MLHASPHLLWALSRVEHVTLLQVQLLDFPADLDRSYMQIMEFQGDLAIQEIPVISDGFGNPRMQCLKVHEASDSCCPSSGISRQF